MNKAKHIHLRIVETTDVHGAIFPFDLMQQDRRQGSLAQVHAFVKKERGNPNQEVILLENGDILQGTPVVYYANFEDKRDTHFVAQVLNYMHYDAATVGNHDIETGHAVYDVFRKDLNCELLAANAMKNESDEPYFTPYKIIEKQGVKIAVLGLITPAIPNWLPPNIYSGMHFVDMIESARYWQKVIREKENPDVLIGLFHSGVDASYGGGDPKLTLNENAVQLVAEQVPGFDVIFAGHDHQVANFNVLNNKGDSTLIIDPGAHAMSVGIADISLNWDDTQQKYIKKVEGTIQSMEEVVPDSNFKYKFNPMLVKVDKYVKKPIARLKTRLTSSQALYGPSSFLSLIHQAQLEIADADISFAAAFSLNTQLDTGMLYVRDMFKLYRYENFLYKIEMTGAEIQDYLEFAYALRLNNSSDINTPLFNYKKDENGNFILDNRGRRRFENAFYNFDAAAGIIYEVNTEKEVGERVHILSMKNGEAFDENKKYSVVMNSYRANGGGKIMSQGAHLDTDAMMKRLLWASDVDFRLLFMRWLESKRNIKVQIIEDWKITPKSRVNQSDREI